MGDGLVISKRIDPSGELSKRNSELPNIKILKSRDGRGISRSVETSKSQAVSLWFWVHIKKGND